MNLYPVAIVENFYENPDAIRQYALEQEYQFCHERPNLKYVYPGSRTKDLFDLDRALHEKVCNKLISVFHNTEHDYMRWAISTSFQSVTEEYKEGVIHTDGDTIFAAVVFLTPNAPLEAGTSLYKKGKSFDQSKYAQALTDNEVLFRAGDVGMSTDYHQMFDEVVRVNNVYNTIVIYEGRHFHAANQFFGQTLQNSRLTQVFFINKIDAQKQSVFPISRTQQIKI